MKYKVGDKVKIIKSYFAESKNLGKIGTINAIDDYDTKYRVEGGLINWCENNHDWCKEDELELVEEQATPDHKFQVGDYVEGIGEDITECQGIVEKIRSDNSCLVMLTKLGSRRYQNGTEKGWIIGELAGSISGTGVYYSASALKLIKAKEEPQVYKDKIKATDLKVGDVIHYIGKKFSWNDAIIRIKEKVDFDFDCEILSHKTATSTINIFIPTFDWHYTLGDLKGCTKYDSIEDAPVLKYTNPKYYHDDGSLRSKDVERNMIGGWEVPKITMKASKLPDFERFPNGIERKIRGSIVSEAFKKEDVVPVKESEVRRIYAQAGVKYESPKQTLPHMIVRTNTKEEEGKLLQWLEDNTDLKWYNGCSPTEYSSPFGCIIIKDNLDGCGKKYANPKGYPWVSTQEFFNKYDKQKVEKEEEPDGWYDISYTLTHTLTPPFIYMSTGTGTTISPFNQPVLESITKKTMRRLSELTQKVRRAFSKDQKALFKAGYIDARGEWSNRAEQYADDAMREAYLEENKKEVIELANEEIALEKEENDCD